MRNRQCMQHAWNSQQPEAEAKIKSFIENIGGGGGVEDTKMQSKLCWGIFSQLYTPFSF